MSKTIKIDPNNFNRHTEDGMALLETSIKEVGVIESITIDKEGEIVTGNARFEIFEKLGLKPKLVKISDNEYPVIATNLDGEKRVKAAILANTTAKKNIYLDIDLIQEIAVDEFDIEIEKLGVEIIDFDCMELDNLSENSLRDQINSTGQTQITFVFDVEYKDIIENYLRRHSKKTLQNELLKIMQNA